MRRAGVLVAVLLLAGCTAPAPEPVESPTAHNPIVTPTPTPGPRGTVLATGHFDPADGVTGTIELVVGDTDRYEVRVTGFSSTLPAEAQLMLSPFPLITSRTSLDGPSFALGAPAGGDTSIVMGGFPMASGDPSFLDGAAMAMYVEADHVESGCNRTILAKAPFLWVIPDLRPNLAVADLGEREGARGEVTVVASRPISYAVAPNDVLEAIADRFDITVEDLIYLNPFRGSGVAQRDEVLNLDRDNRSAPWG